MTFDVGFRYIEDMVQEAWCIKVNGKYVVLRSGKRSWSSKRNAAIALRNHCEKAIYVEADVIFKKQKIEDPSATRWDSYNQAIENYRNWVKEHVEFVRLI